MLRTFLRRYDSADRDTTRLEAFSDGVLAIAITLLVLEVHVPDLQGEERKQLWSALGDLWPSYLGFVVSFLVIGIIWANHHDIFKHIERVNRPLVLLNMIFLLTVSFFPFPTALVAAYLGHDGEKTAAIVYTGWCLLMSFTFNALWQYAVRAGLTASDSSVNTIVSISRRARLGPPLYLIAFIDSFIFPGISVFVAACMTCFYALPFGFQRDAG